MTTDPTPEPEEEVAIGEFVDENEQPNIEDTAEKLKESFSALSKTDIVFGALGTVGTFMVGSGTAKITKSIIENNIDPGDLTKYSKVTVVMASAVIGMMAKDATKAHFKTKMAEAEKSANDAQSSWARLKHLIKTTDVDEADPATPPSTDA